MKNQSIYTAFIALTILFASCQSCKPAHDCYQSYKVAVPISLYPARDTFKIGDTIWLESEISNLLFDSISQEYIDFKDFSHKIHGGISKYNTPVQPYAESDFRFVNIDGTIEVIGSGPKFLKLKYINKTSESQRIKVGLIPETTGLFRLGFLTFSEDYYTEIGIIKQNCTETIIMRFNMNERLDDNNFYLLQGYPNINSADGFRNEGEYAFWVTD